MVRRWYRTRHGGPGASVQAGGETGPYQIRDLGRGDRAAEQEALREPAAVRPEELVLPAGLDTLGERRHPQRLGELDHGAHHAGEIAVAIHVADERLVDLQDVHGHVLQSRER